MMEEERMANSWRANVEVMLGTTLDAKSEPNALATRGIPFLLEGTHVARRLPEFVDHNSRKFQNCGSCSTAQTSC